MSDRVEQAIRLLSGPCPHNRPDSDAPRSKGGCLQCIAETARAVIMKEIEYYHIAGCMIGGPCDSGRCSCQGILEHLKISDE